MYLPTSDSIAHIERYSNCQEAVTFADFEVDPLYNPCGTPRNIYVH
jgi:hypothetical protein